MILNVLVACEESQTVANAFRKLGHNAYSCDLQPCSGGHPEYHIMGDCLSLINGKCHFVTESGIYHTIPGTWDLVIAHPPCTYLTKASATLLYPHGVLDHDRLKKVKEAAIFFRRILNADVPYLAIENPTPLHIANLPVSSQVIEPYYFGHNCSKCTNLWLRNLPPLFSTGLYVQE